MISAQLPAALREALEGLAAPFAQRELVAAAARLSHDYRAGRPASIARPLDAAAYALTRMPATYAALTAALRWVPGPFDSILDLGSGTGAAAWAAAAVLDVDEITLVETNPEMRRAGESLAPQRAHWRGGDFRNLAGFAPHALVSFSYSLGELPEREALETVRRAWSLAQRALVVVEPGTPKASAFILKVREVLLAEGAHIAAPCPHALACPLRPPDWCHFAVRVERMRLHRLLKGGDLGYEDEKFSYVAAVREPVLADAARILRHPWQEPGAITLQLCAPEGLTTRTVTKREKSVFRLARKASWGMEWKESADDPGTD